MMKYNDSERVLSFRNLQRLRFTFTMNKNLHIFSRKYMQIYFLYMIYDSQKLNIFKKINILNVSNTSDFQMYIICKAISNQNF